MAQARAEAAAARRSLDEANQLRGQLAGHKSRLEAEVELLKAEAAKVMQTQRALVEASGHWRERGFGRWVLHDSGRFVGTVKLAHCPPRSKVMLAPA